MKKTLTILKLGGSLLTDKSSPSLIRKEIIRAVAREIKKSIDMGLIENLILVHGVGSVGHPPVLKHKLHYGFQNQDQLLALSQTQLAVNKFRNLLVEEFSKVGLPIILFHASSMSISKKMVIQEFYTTSFQGYMSLGMIPLLGGDMIYDEGMGFSVGSGDQLVTWLTRELNALRVIFASNVLGIYDKDPNIESNAKLYPTISISELEQIISNTGSETIGKDVSGAMKGKLTSIASLKPLIKRGSQVNIISMLESGNLIKLLKNESEIGTKFVL